MEDPVLCPQCLHENKEKSTFCENCNTPIGIVATSDPVSAAISEGRIISDGVNKTQKKIVVIGLWILLGPSLLFFIYLMFISSGTTLFTVIFIIMFSTIYATLLFNVTKNYLKWKNEHSKETNSNENAERMS